MNRETRNEMASTLSKSALAYSTVASIDREYTMEEIAIMT
jgi:formylmethanofuran dehydrogenase subunit A